MLKISELLKISKRNPWIFKKYSYLCTIEPTMPRIRCNFGYMLCCETGGSFVYIDLAIMAKPTYDKPPVTISEQNDQGDIDLFQSRSYYSGGQE